MVCKYFLVLGLLFAVNITESFAGQIKGPGVSTCGSWLEDRKRNNDAAELGWVFGFISSYNNYVYKGSDSNGAFGSADHYAIIAWLDNYFSRNPLKTIYHGAMDLIREIYSSANR